MIDFPVSWSVLVMNRYWDRYQQNYQFIQN